MIRRPINVVKAPFPWFGGKQDAAPAVWEALGDVDHFVDPFMGSLAVVLRRPPPCNRPYFSETVNDADGLLVNAWRSIQLSPDATAEAASWPVAEADLMARHLALVRWRAERNLEALMGDPEWHDPKMAGWFLWGQSSWIGRGWCSGRGPWVVGDDGRITKGAGGVSRKRPNLGNNGKGANHAGLGVNRQIPHISDNGMGVNHSGLREEGVAIESEFHPMTMPEIRRWFQFLSARLRHVRILNGDWQRAVTSGASKTLPVRQGGHVGIFLDPPYSAEAGRKASIYTKEDLTVAHAVREWARIRGTDSDTRIVLAGFDGEHNSLEADGWTAVEWFKAGFLKGGMGNVGDTNQQHRERLWLSPHCLRPVAESPRQAGLFGAEA